MGDLKTIASPELGNARFMSLLRLDLKVEDRQMLTTGESEYVLDIISGKCNVVVNRAGKDSVRFDRIGGRKDIFSGLPELVYVPRESVCEVEAISDDLKAVIYAAPTKDAQEPVYIGKEKVRVVESGTSDWQRTVYIAIDDKGPATRMMVGESDCPPGNWSSFPPHRHAADKLPSETEMEELYYLQIKPESGFVIGGIYQDPKNKQSTADLRIYSHGECFDVPDGYHFIAPCPGYRVRYTWALGGKNRGFGAWKIDPELAWLNEYTG